MDLQRIVINFHTINDEGTRIVIKAGCPMIKDMDDPVTGTTDNQSNGIGCYLHLVELLKSFGFDDDRMASQILIFCTDGESALVSENVGVYATWRDRINNVIGWNIDCAHSMESTLREVKNHTIREIYIVCGIILRIF